jgi:hypothetical protein
VTPPLPEGSGFSGRFRSLTGKPCPQNVLGCVYVGVSPVATRHAAEVGLADAVSCSDMPAPRATLRGVTGIGLNYYSSGAFSLGAAEERGERLVQAAQGGLLGAERPPALTVGVIPADVLQVSGLLPVLDRDPCALVSSAAVFQRGVVKLPVIFQARRQSGCLLRGGSQQKLVGSSHLHRVLVFGVDTARGGCRLAGPLACKSYGLGTDIPGRARWEEGARLHSSLKAGVPAAHL